MGPEAVLQMFVQVRGRQWAGRHSGPASPPAVLTMVTQLLWALRPPPQAEIVRRQFLSRGGRGVDEAFETEVLQSSLKQVNDLLSAVLLLSQLHRLYQSRWSWLIFYALRAGSSNLLCGALMFGVFNGTSKHVEDYRVVQARL